MIKGIIIINSIFSLLLTMSPNLNVRIPVISATHSGAFRPAVAGDSGHSIGAERRWS
jgi:hypothetical protein